MNRVALIIRGLAMLCVVCTVLPSLGAPLKTKNVFLITTDGFRWQEVFTGAEELLISKANGGVAITNALREDFWREAPAARREVLLSWPDTPPLGERTNCPPVTQSQIAATVAAFLEQDFLAHVPKAGAPIADAIGK